MPRDSGRDACSIYTQRSEEYIGACVAKQRSSTKASCWERDHVAVGGLGVKGVEKDVYVVTRPECYYYVPTGGFRCLYLTQVIHVCCFGESRRVYRGPLESEGKSPRGDLYVVLEVGRYGDRTAHFRGHRLDFSQHIQLSESAMFLSSYPDALNRRALFACILP